MCSAKCKVDLICASVHVSTPAVRLSCRSIALNVLLEWQVATKVCICSDLGANQRSLVIYRDPVCVQEIMSNFRRVVLSRNTGTGHRCSNQVNSRQGPEDGMSIATDKECLQSACMLACMHTAAAKPKDCSRAEDVLWGRKLRLPSAL